MVLPAMAVEQNPANQSPIDLSAGEGRAIAPTIGISFSYDSNTYDTDIGGNNSWIGVVAPAVLLTSPPAQKRYALLYTGEYGHFFADSADNYNDHSLTGAARFQFGSRGQADVAGVIEKGHRDRGSGQTDGLDPSSPLFPTQPDVFDRNTLAGKFHYGADGNRGRLNFGLGASQFEYTNNSQRTQFLNYDTQFASAGLSLLFHQRTAFVFDVIFTNTDYDRIQTGAASRDNKDWRYLVGMTWLATGKTEGSIRLGIQQRRFDDSTRAQSSNPSWAVDVRWSPREYSHFDFVTSRANEETDREGLFIDRSIYRLAWTHEWSRGWQSIARWERRDSEFVDSARDEDWSEYYLGMRIPQGRLLTWDVGYARRSRDSSLERLVFDGNMFSIGVNVGT